MFCLSYHWWDLWLLQHCKISPAFSFNSLAKYVMQLSVLHCFSQIVTCSTDKMLSMWDCTVGTRIRKYRGHQSFVNSCDIARRGPQLMCSASDDCTVRVSNFFRFIIKVNQCNCIHEWFFFCTVILHSVSGGSKRWPALSDDLLFLLF